MEFGLALAGPLFGSPEFGTKHQPWRILLLESMNLGSTGRSRVERIWLKA